MLSDKALSLPSRGIYSSEIEHIKQRKKLITLVMVDQMSSFK